MNYKQYALIFLFIIFLASCKDTTKETDTTKEAATLYYNGDIITMEGDNPATVEAVVEQDGKIVFVGELEEAEAQYGNTGKFDLGGATMLPGFIEPHAHPVSIGALILASEIIAPHEWRFPHKTFPAVDGKEAFFNAISRLVQEKTSNEEPLFIWGYHKAWHGLFTLAELDEITGDVPTIIWQRSTHELFLNSASAKKYQLKKEGFPEKEQVDWDNLHFWERGYQALKGGPLQPFFGDHKVYKKGMARLTQMMLQNGLIAMSEPSFPNSNFDTEYNLLKEETDKANSYGIYLIPGFPEQFVMGLDNDTYKKRLDTLDRYNTEHIKFLPNQFKTFADGAIYSLGLQMKDGFYNCKECHAEWIIPLEQAQEIFDYWWDSGYKIHIHITGDLGFERYLDFTESAMKRNPRENHRTTFHHIGYFTAEQAQKAADLGAEMSANVYYLWALADKYSEIGMGAERAANMVAVNELTSRNIPVSFHSDFSMAPAEPLNHVWVAVNRQVASGKVMNPEQSISVYEALKGVTITAARTFEMENELGSIREGKEASFTILEENPLEVDPLKIRDIKVKGVVYKGRHIENTATPHLAGGWSTTEIGQEVEQVVNYVLGEMKNPSPLKEIRSARKQRVKGMNYEVVFTLEDNTTWTARVYQDLEGKYSLMEDVSQQ